MIQAIEISHTLYSAGILISFMSIISLTLRIALYTSEPVSKQMPKNQGYRNQTVAN